MTTRREVLAGAVAACVVRLPGVDGADSVEGLKRIVLDELAAGATVLTLLVEVGAMSLGKSGSVREVKLSFTAGAVGMESDRARGLVWGRSAHDGTTELRYRLEYDPVEMTLSMEGGGSHGMWRV